MCYKAYNKDIVLYVAETTVGVSIGYSRRLVSRTHASFAEINYIRSWRVK